MSFLMYTEKAFNKHIKSETSRKITRWPQFNEHYGYNMICCGQRKKESKMKKKNNKHVTEFEENVHFEEKFS